MVGMTRKWKARENMSAWPVPSLLPFYFRFRAFSICGPDFLGAWNRLPQNKTLNNVISAAAFIIVIVYLPTSQFITISLFSQKFNNVHRVQRSFVWINKLLNQSLTLKNVYTCRLARLISPMGSLWIYCKRFLRFLSDPDRLCCSPFWKSITASHSLAGARHVARRATEGRRPKGDRGTKCRVKKT